MIKKISLISLLLATSVNVTLAAAPYVGASLGVLTNTTNRYPNGSVMQPSNFRGVPASVFAGFGGVVSQNFYLAGEVSTTLFTGEISDNTGLKTSYGVGASVLPGFMLSDHTLAFARAGVVRTRFSDADQMQNGGQVGLGLQTTVMQNVDVRGEYDYTSYGSFNNSTGRISAPCADGFTLGLLYKFD